ncbi:hypothetical protein [Actinoplanes sp. NPDC026619]|uniref:hypothetical protein n=1 Tax=Actinoplanes sp. NPDC026619 TaxID=3155798 RepID=UPI0033C0BAE9
MRYLEWHLRAFPVRCWDEVDDERRSLRHVEFDEELVGYTAAASLAETLHARDTGGVGGVVAYERRFGVSPEGPVPDVHDGAVPLAAEEFERIWTAARSHLD